MRDQRWFSKQSTSFFFIGLKFDYQPPPSSLQARVTSLLEDSFLLHRHQESTWYIDIYVDKTHKNIILKEKKERKVSGM